MNQALFMDYLSTTPVDPRVIQAVTACMCDVIGNSSSVDHSFGIAAARVVDNARRQLAELLGAGRAKVIFTSGATEAINIVLRHTIRQVGPNRKARIVLSPLEHAAVLETCADLSSGDRAELAFLPVDDKGRVQIESLAQELSKGADLVCVMAANNEIGNLYPIKEIADICNRASVPFLCDASQAAGKVEIVFDEWKLTYLIVSSHKMYGPKGAGAIVVDRKFLPSALQTGGNQEFSVRPGTVNVPAIAGFGEAARLRVEEMNNDEAAIKAKRDQLQQALQQTIPNLCVNGDQDLRLAGVLHVSIPGIPNDAVIMRIKDSLAISRGAACSSGIEKPSHVLRAMRLGDELIEGALRISIGKFTSGDEIVRAVELLSAAVAEVRSALGRVPYQKVC